MWFVEDDARVRAVSGRMLSHLGFQVVEFASGEEALAWVEQTDQWPAFAVVDALMPGIDGLATIAALREHLTEMPALLCSGYREADEGLHLPVGVRFLAKPFSIEQLEDAVAALLEVSKTHALGG